MDFRRLSKLHPPAEYNSTEPLELTALPANILDALIPGYSLISRYAQVALGFDPSLFVSLAVILFAGTKGSHYFYTKLSNAWRYFFLSSVFIDEHDDLFDMLMDWLAATHTSSSRRSVRAKTQRRNDEFDAPDDDALDSDGMFDYNRWSARTPPRYEPYYGQHVLWHQGRLFLLRRSQRASQSQSLQVRFGGNNEDDVLQLDCLGRSIEPIRDLLRTVKVWSLQRQRHTTTIRHPTPKDRARFSGSWSKTFSRPSRPMDTVILDAVQKKMIVKDMNEYLHPSSPKWYALRGIPYRRGYLFHGPPGTGKTSLSFALAGIFGLEIYVISLQDSTTTEADLMQLFNGLPKRCIVLLEDVDAAGLVRDRDSDGGSSDAQGKGRRGKEVSKQEGENSREDHSQANNSDFTLRDLARELKSISSPRGMDRKQGNLSAGQGQGISLSGLLNAIDGVASHEGRVLIMTTNHPEKLDAALVRPGRVDRRVQFALAKKPQVEELFFRMYNTDYVAANSVAAKGSVHKDVLTPNGHASKMESSDSKTLSSKNTLQAQSVEFASHVPDSTFTPAEIQNHLMRYKNEPSMALKKVDEWIGEVLAAKSKDGEEEDD